MWRVGEGFPSGSYCSWHECLIYDFYGRFLRNISLSPGSLLKLVVLSSLKRRDRVGSTFQLPHTRAPPMISHAQAAEGCSQLLKLKHKTIQKKKKQTDSIIFQALVSPLALLVLSSGIFHHASLHFENSFKKLLNREKTWALLSLALGGYLLTTNTESFQAVFPRSARATTSALSFLERFPYLC